jgi:predicted nucleic-acid-binding protein
MVAVDTNVIVRLLTADDRAQYAAARRLFATESIWIAKTVLLETAWVLGSLYGFDSSSIRDALVRTLGLSNVHVEEEAAVASALNLMTHGIDIADALHLASRPPAASFVSFDRAFVRHARSAGVAGVSGIAGQ